MTNKVFTSHIVTLGMAFMFGLAALAHSEEKPADAIVARLKGARPDLEFRDVKPSPVKGLYEVQVVDGPLIYVSEDGAYFLAGDLFQVQANSVVNLAEHRRADERKVLIAQVRTEDMIVFAPPVVKATLTVFTDVDCGYCRKFHTEVPELNKMGIAVRYLAYPRAGLGSPSYKKIVTVWCSSNRQEALTRFKRGEILPENLCDKNPVADEMMLGELVGVNGTPALILEDGTMLPGYRTAQELAKMLGVI